MHSVCLFLLTVTGPAEMLAVPEMGLQGLYIGKTLLPPPACALTHHPSHPDTETHP